jgi:site-specific DNA-adenine methylase
MGKPIINYIGNKYRYGKILDNLGLIPEKIDNYVEPFIGGAGFLCYLSEVRDIKKITIKKCYTFNQLSSDERISNYKL